MEFKDWLVEKFLEWEKSTGKRQPYVAFARYLGVKQSALSQWLNGNNIPTLEYVKIIAEKLGVEAYALLGYPMPGEIGGFAGFPLAFREALREASERIISLGLNGDSPEAAEIITEAMTRRGYKVTRIEQDGSST